MVNGDALALAEKVLGFELGGIVSMFAQLDWAEEEIEAAQRRHRIKAPVLYHAFRLLEPTLPLMRTEFVYRAHCRELLDRLATGGDTRPGTDAEMAIVCSEMSQVAPLNTAGVTVYMRCWRRAFPDKDVFGKHVPHYEHIASGEADILENGLRRKLSNVSRVIGAVQCEGRHHGERVFCPYTKRPVARRVPA
jgi:hypothetical protein